MSPVRALGSSNVISTLSLENKPHAETATGLSIDMLFEQHAKTVARWAARLGGPWVDPEDVVQEVFVKAHRELPRFRNDARITTWLYRATLNVVRSIRRKEKFRTALGLEVSTQSSRFAHEDAQRDLESQQEQDAVHRALDRLSERSREVLVLFELEQRSGEEVAELLGAKVETVWVWLHRARKQLAQALATNETGSEP